MKLNTSSRRKYRVTNKVRRVASVGRLRLSIYRSSKNISAQIIDDNQNITVLSASSIEKDIKNIKTSNKSELSKVVAEKLAKKAREKKLARFILTEVFISIMVELKFLLKH